MAEARTRIRKSPMSRVDTAWLRMERPTNLMMITGVMMFETPLDIRTLRKVIETKFLAYPRFRQKAVDTPTGAFWQDDADFDLDWHVRLTALPGRGGKRELERLTSQMASTPLDKTKPLWQFHLVEKFGGGSALISRIHHCYADGIALVQVLLSLTEMGLDPKRKAALAKRWLKKEEHAPVAQRVGAIDRYMQIGGKMLEKGMDFYRDPTLAAVLATEGVDIAKEVGLALSLSDDPETVLKGRLGVSKRVAWAEPLPLEEVKSVSRALRCTVNDILLASASGALRSYMLERGEQLEGITIRATVPVNLRPLEHAKQLGNHFGLVFLELPVGEANPMRRLERITASMKVLRKSRQAVATFGALAAVGMAPPAVQAFALEMFSRKASAVATNVPGPQMPLYFGGSKITDLMFWVPQTGSIGLGISILSYNGAVHFGLIADAKLMPDPDSVIRRFRPEFEKLLYLALMAKWEGEFCAEAAEALMVDLT
ncbi:MAG TPA: wax ester/triacylglycerol synthase family O-acyltransferase [Arenimonas sp.]|uniref:WS/DGAT/MGAT family O-acyltransferase n=1 Tax=Arenimonas sp. TaxID=1872635 RepID=UPI002D7E3E9E|nr:wax ester/triacylglycerol synthase family O-acyltransferase [Arenimonas sp.]HEU0153848.1 wax ester/triacylglycerol synthase family O-acyltransferase [Arenimonas sp.]